MAHSYDNYHYYRSVRRTFAWKVYVLFIFWLLLTLAQTSLICLIEDTRKFVAEYFYVCLITFGIAVLLFAIFIFSSTLRLLICCNFIWSLIIVELQIISLFLFAVHVFLPDLLAFFAISLLLLVLFLLCGCCLPRSADLTSEVAVLFIFGFVCLIVAMFFLVVKFVLTQYVMYAYLIAEIAVSLALLMFVMYHSQTIMGSRYAEMRSNDALLGSLILYHHFLIIYWLTFYWQIRNHPLTPQFWIDESTPQSKGSTAKGNSSNKWLEDYGG